MPLKPIVDTLDEIAEPMREHYTERDGKFHLAVEGLVPKERVAEFRDTNIALKREMDELRTRFDGIDPDEYRKLNERAQKERDKKLIDAGKLDELVDQRVSGMKAEHEKVLRSLTEEKAKLGAQLEGLVIDGAIRDAATKAGARPEAIEDFLYRGRRIFRLQEGKAVPLDEDRVVYGKSGGPMEISEWVSTLAEKAPHLFQPTTGGGGRTERTATRTPGTISREDGSAFIQNLDKIAKGELKVA